MRITNVGNYIIDYTIYANISRLNGNFKNVMHINIIDKAFLSTSAWLHTLYMETSSSSTIICWITAISSLLISRLVFNSNKSSCS